MGSRSAVVALVLALTSSVAADPATPAAVAPSVAAGEAPSAAPAAVPRASLAALGPDGAVAALAAPALEAGVTATVDDRDDVAGDRGGVRALRRHALSIELFGRGGLWGVGYDYLVNPRLALGATASFFAVDGERVTTLSPYVGVYPLGGRHHRWFVQGGPRLVRLVRPSPVPEWPGMSTTGVGGALASGYEYRGRLLVRAFGMATAGKGGVRPWLGVSLGVTL
jgi:hypothetical protein